jgi:group I intron endonuclease
MFGVYQIRNLVNDKRYIGSSSNKRGIRQRWIIHRHHLEHNRHHSPHLQRAWNKYGADLFVFEILLYCDPENCLMYEQIALDCLKPEYNVCRVASSRLGTKISEETRIKCRLANTGRRASSRTRQKMSIAKQGIKNSNAKLDERDVRVIKRALRIGIQQKKIASRFQVTERTVRYIKSGARWN